MASFFVLISVAYCLRDKFPFASVVSLKGPVLCFFPGNATEAPPLAPPVGHRRPPPARRHEQIDRKSLGFSTFLLLIKTTAHDIATNAYLGFTFRFYERISEGFTLQYGRRMIHTRKTGNINYESQSDSPATSSNQLFSRENQTVSAATKFLDESHRNPLSLRAVCVLRLCIVLSFVSRQTADSSSIVGLPFLMRIEFQNGP